jgi:hypothetical protein
MNLPRPFNKRICETIDAFMKTKPIFQSPHSKDFMHPNDTMFAANHHELKYITSGLRSPMHEDLDAKLMRMKFNVVGNFMSHIIPSLATPIFLISHIAIIHHHLPTRPCYTSGWQQGNKERNNISHSLHA